METSEATRFLKQKEDQEEGVIIWKGKENLLLPSMQWRPVRSPGSNPGTNSFTDVTSQISERNFAGRKEVVGLPQEQGDVIRKGKENLLLPSLQWRPIRSPGSNPGTNSFPYMTSQISERNFVDRREIVHPPQEEGVIIWKEKENLLLPSLQQRPVRSPGSNSGTNSFTDVTSQISERNFAGRKEVVRPSQEEGVKIWKGKENFLLPSLQWHRVRSPGSNPGTNSFTDVTSQISERNFAVRPPQVNRATNSRTDVTVQVSERNFAGRNKEVSRPRPPVPPFSNEYPHHHKISSAISKTTSSTTI
ncbi:hypothetical protein HAX54_008299 [Datura stramonium]|uniref:Uncharacterized protein n=1 Tax=Datura stramonium TaxID=4076 RepID=A0ABS8RVB1_DATST|nr:hypothetical protein [Datura stramonium]